jgi:hypothetical protein
MGRSGWPRGDHAASVALVSESAGGRRVWLRGPAVVALDKVGHDVIAIPRNAAGSGRAGTPFRTGLARPHHLPDRKVGRSPEILVSDWPG